jgi:hypothetical protein
MQEVAEYHAGEEQEREAQVRQIGLCVRSVGRRTEKRRCRDKRQKEMCNFGFSTSDRRSREESHQDRIFQAVVLLEAPEEVAHQYWK